MFKNKIYYLVFCLSFFLTELSHGIDQEGDGPEMLSRPVVKKFGAGVDISFSEAGFDAFLAPPSGWHNRSWVLEKDARVLAALFKGQPTDFKLPKNFTHEGSDVLFYRDITNGDGAFEDISEDNVRAMLRAASQGIKNPENICLCVLGSGAAINLSTYWSFKTFEEKTEDTRKSYGVYVGSLAHLLNPQNGWDANCGGL